jgi:hypothetical protein
MSTHIRVSEHTRDILRALQDQWACDSVEQVLNWVLYNTDFPALTVTRNRAIMGLPNQENDHDDS